jgi:hypothetical protein
MRSKFSTIEPINYEEIAILESEKMSWNGYADFKAAVSESIFYDDTFLNSRD